MMCSQFDEFFDGELEQAAAATFREHLTTCDRCQASLRGRMQEALVVDEAAPAVIALPQRRLRYAMIGSAVALAAAVALVWSFHKPAPPQIAMVGVKLTVEKGAATMRGSSAHVGDRVHAQATGPLWIYRGDHELVLACPGGAGCRADGADLDITAMGTYQFVSLGPTTIVPHGDFDTDVAAAATANVKYKVEMLEVQ
jgi:hypothetical protein